MGISPQKMREVVFLLIYSADFGSPDADVMTKMLMRELAVSKTVLRAAHVEKCLVQEKLPEIDPIISSHSKAYDFVRIPGIERNILRLGIYEILYAPKIPAKVAIAEAIRLARKFATPEASTFVNAILDAVYQIELKDPQERSDAIPVSV